MPEQPDQPDEPDQPDLDRPRDAQGRPRNARPRDALGRPLPYGEAGTPRQPEGVVRTPEQTVAEARGLLAAGRPFHAHEVFEDAWKAAGDDRDRRLWHGLAQLAVGLTHAARGNPSGATRLLDRGAATLEPLAALERHGLSVPALIRWSRESIEAIRDDSGAPIALMPLRQES